MRYTLHINQKQAVELGISNVNQAIILHLIGVSATWADTAIIDNEVYYHISRNKIIDELPLLNIKPDTAYRHLKSLVDLGFIEYVKKGKKDLVRLTKKGKSYYDGNKSENELNSEINPTKLGNKSENNSEINPTYNTTTTNNTTNNNINDKKGGLSYEEFVSMWNSYATNANKSIVLKLSSGRKSKLLSRNKELKDFKKAFELALQKATASAFLKENNFFSFDWLISNDENIIKVIEDKYKNKEVEYK